jgi:hypothetical protein
MLAMAGRLPDDVRDFLRAHIGSVELLEVLLLLRVEADRTWDPAGVADRLRRSESSIGSRLKQLQGDGLLVAVEGGFRYDGAAAHERTVGELARCFASRRAAVVEEIYADDEDDPARSLADAFRMRPR